MSQTTIIKSEQLEVSEAGWFDMNPFGLRLLAEGDSWFSLGSIPGHNLLEALQFAESAVILNLAYPGDEVREMFRRMCDYGGEFAGWMSMRSTYRWDAILLSGGGNDLIAAFPHLLRADILPNKVDPARPDLLVDDAALALLDRYLIDSYTGFVNCRDRPAGRNAGVPMIVHTYDYPTPNDAPALAFGIPVSGPWIHPLVKDRLPREAWVALTDYLLDHVAETLLALPARLPNFHVIDTRGTLARAPLGARGASPDWENEIHPSRGGYRKLAAKVAAYVQKRFEA